MNKRSILHPDFKYTPAATTDIRKTFKRIKREQAEQKSNVTEIRKARKA